MTALLLVDSMTNRSVQMKEARHELESCRGLQCHKSSTLDAYFSTSSIVSAFFSPASSIASAFFSPAASILSAVFSAAGF